MNNYEKLIEEVVDRAIAKRNMPLAELIESENLNEYIPGTITILYGNELGSAIVPCRGHMILVRDRYDEISNDVIAEYAIYREHDNDGHNLYNSLNANATYKLEFVGEETFENMAYAIKYAVELIEKISDDPVDIVRNMTDGDPLKDLTEEDAVHLIAEAVNKGYAVPASLTAEKFLEIYNDLKGD